ncbi:MAG TPA: hypothetical protein VNN62_05250 [Methylomirabilota bacterium]|jgi:hypothetical protein|nr:hypothetical protein [Methylomirabilota bacterium]
MQQAQNIHSFPGRHETVPPLQIATVHPPLALWFRQWMQKTLTKETAAEAVFGVAALALFAVLFLSLARGMAHYTIVPVP